MEGIFKKVGSYMKQTSSQNEGFISVKKKNSGFSHELLLLIAPHFPLAPHRRY